MRIQIRKKDYLLSSLGTREIIQKRLKIGHVRCPKCRQFFGIYQDEFYDDGTPRKPVFHACGFKALLEFEGLDEESFI